MDVHDIYSVSLSYHLKPLEVGIELRMCENKGFCLRTEVPASYFCPR